MPAKKTASRKRKLAKALRKKAAKRKPVIAKKTAGVKRKVSKKKVAGGKAGSKKKPVANKKISKKKVAKKKSARKTISRRKATRRSRDILSGPIHGVSPYVTKRGEDYMGAKQLAHFKAILIAWKKELMSEADRTVHHMQDEAANFPDPNDRATQESEFGLELRTRDRERKLLLKINSALIRIDDGDYGYCEETGEEIGLRRLEARPVATLCLEAQERREMAERQFRDRDDRYR